MKGSVASILYQTTFVHETKLIKFQHSETETQALHSGTHGPIYHRRSLFHLGQILRQDLLLMGLQSGLWLTQERHTYQKKKSSKPMHVVQGIPGAQVQVQQVRHYVTMAYRSSLDAKMSQSKCIGVWGMPHSQSVYCAWLPGTALACAPQSMCAIGSLNTTPPPLPFCIQYILHMYVCVHLCSARM